MKKKRPLCFPSEIKGNQDLGDTKGNFQLDKHGFYYNILPYSYHVSEDQMKKKLCRFFGLGIGDKPVGKQIAQKKVGTEGERDNILSKAVKSQTHDKIRNGPLPFTFIYTGIKLRFRPKKGERSYLFSSALRTLQKGHKLSCG